jgi:ABC-type uncharacterized transport system permease subunit
VSARAGLVYFAVVFAAGVVLGTLRVLVVAPALGEVAAVVLELPLMLAVSWIACGRIVERLRVPPHWRARAAMGAVAFGVLMAAEAGLAILAFGRSPAEHLVSYRDTAARLGLAGQVAFALMPLLRR